MFAVGVADAVGVRVGVGISDMVCVCVGEGVTVVGLASVVVAVGAGEIVPVSIAETAALAERESRGNAASMRNAKQTDAQS